MELTEDDVLEILKLFEQSKFDFLQLQQGERQITVSDMLALMLDRHASPADLRRLVAVPALAAVWREEFESRLGM